MTPLFVLLSLLACVPVYQHGGIPGVVGWGLLLTWLHSWWYQTFAAAGPLTSRQVPPQPIARCQQLSAQELSSEYQRGTLSCVEVVSAYIEHIRRVNPYLNCMVFECFDEALAAAEEADREWAAWRAARGRRPMPSWLLGVPCTIKECMEVRGCPNSSGHPLRAGLLSTRDSPVVANFRAAGAVILGVTNTSELCMWFESTNHVYGITCNPYDTRCLVGGSSGGEGCAAGAAFATFSVGSDIGGSIRMPAFFNGVYGLKASPHYISNHGQFPGAKSSAHHYMATGPITRFPQDVAPLCEIAARGGFRMDPAVYPPRGPLGGIPALPVVDAKTAGAAPPFTVYALEDFGLPFISVTESMKAAVHAAAAVLAERHGARVVTVNIRDASRCTGGRVPPEFLPFSQVIRMWGAVLTKDPTETRFHEMMEVPYGHRVNWFAELLRWAVGRSRHTLPAIGLCIIESAEHYLPSFLNISQDTQLSQFREGLARLLGDDGVIVCPSFPSPAVRHHYVDWSCFQFQYTAAFNVLQFPAMACPVWQPEVRPGQRAPSHLEVRAAGGPADAHLPKGVQVVCAPHRDERVISVALALHEALGGYRYPSWARLEGKDY